MPDVSVLVCAHRMDEQVHAAYKRWLKELIDGPQPFALSLLVAVAFVRTVTNPRIYRTPTPLPLALATIDQIVSHPRCRLVAPCADHWQRVATLCRLTTAGAKQVADAQHAAVPM